jgi:spore maturation protein CgeB
MRVAFFGSSLVSAYWNGAATYYRGLLRALHALGWDVTFFEPDAFGRQQHRDIDDPDWARVVVYENRVQGMERALEMAAGADLVVKASGVGVFDRELEERVLDAAPGATVVYWDVDAPATLDRLAASPSDPLRPLLPRYDLVLTYGGGEPVRRAYVAAGARECHPVYNALDPDTHFPVARDARFDTDLAFAGNRLPDREGRVDEFFFAPARELPSSRFLLAGNGWGDKARTSNVTYIGHLFTADHNAFNCSPRAVLNISRTSMARYGFSPATRVFEAAGAAACLITDAWEGIELFLEPGREVLVAQDGEAVARHLRDLTPERARAIGAAARARILREHTYAHRAAGVAALLDGRMVSA